MSHAAPLAVTDRRYSGALFSEVANVELSTPALSSLEMLAMLRSH